MKKRFLVLPLALLSLLVVGCDTPTSSSSDGNTSSEPHVSSPSSSSTSVPVAHTITVQGNAELGVSLEADVTSAVAGIDVTITVTNNMPTKTVVNGIKVNGGTTIALTNNSAKFTMPDEDVVVTVDAEKLLYSITDATGGLVNFAGLPEKAQEGDPISFTVYTKPGVTYLEDLVVYSGVPEEDSYTTYTVVATGTYSYSFTMPASNVSISVKTELTEYPLTRGENSGNISTWKNVATSSSSSSLYARAGDVIDVTTRNTDYAKPVGIKVNGQEITTLKEDTDSVYSFTMPARPVVVDTLVTPYYRNITAENSEHLSLTFLQKNEDPEATEQYKTVTSAIAKDKVYVRVNGITDDIIVKSLTGSYKTTNSWNGYEATNSLTINKESDSDLYSFTMPVSNDDTLVVTITEEDLSTYRGQPFVGKYKGAEIYNAGQSSYNQSMSNELELISSGRFAKGNKIENDVILAHDVTNHRLTVGENQDDETKYYLTYTDNLLLYSYYSNKVVDNDVYVFVKDDGSTFTYKKSIFGNKNKKGKDYVAIEIYDDGTLLTGIFADLIKQELYMDVTFSFTQGLSIADKNSAYTVMKDNATIATVGNFGDNLYAVLDGLQGTYTGDNGDLVLDGAATATYQDKTWSYTFNQETNTLNLVSGGDKVSLTLDTNAKTYVALASEAPENDYDGKTYEGSWDDADLESSYKMTVVFGKGGAVEIKIAYSSGMKCYPFDTHPNGGIDTYTINTDGTITITMYDGPTPKQIVLTPNTDKTSFTIDKNFNNGYKTSMCTLTLKA